MGRKEAMSVMTANRWPVGLLRWPAGVLRWPTVSGKLLGEVATEEAGTVPEIEIGTVGSISYNILEVGY